MTDIPKITPTENGPLMVDNPPDLRVRRHDDIETGAKAALCRCGHSANKPFCDGSHAKVGFDSAPDHSKIRNTPIDYSGDVNGVPVTVHYTPVLCTHAAQCQIKAKSVFDPQKSPWIQPENGDLEHILRAIADCPSGALRVSVGAVPGQHMTTGEVEISVAKDGPYYVKNVALDAEFNGTDASRSKYALCRCGQSKNKPFCDGTHYDVSWSDEDDSA